MLGNRISSLDQYGKEFSDTPTALKTVFGRLDNWLQANPCRPMVSNPFLPNEDFAAAWSDEQYSNFRNMVNKYRVWIDDAFNEVDRIESIAKWRRVFGTDFAGAVVLEDAKSISKSAVAQLKEKVGASATFVGDLVDLIKRYGARALPSKFNKQAHMQSPEWRKLREPLFPVYIRANLYQSKGGRRLKESVQPLEPLTPGKWLEFRAVINNGLPPSPNDYRVEWRVTNTDTAAANASCLRGGFYPSEGGQSRFEELKYRGVHLVEAFVIGKRDGTQVAQSEPFQVLIE